MTAPLRLSLRVECSPEHAFDIWTSRTSLARTMRFTDLDEVEAGRADLEAVIRAWCDWKAGASKAADCSNELTRDPEVAALSG